jgi:hypothetical protein
VTRLIIIFASLTTYKLILTMIFFGPLISFDAINVSLLSDCCKEFDSQQTKNQQSYSFLNAEIKILSLERRVLTARKKSLSLTFN